MLLQKNLWNVLKTIFLLSKITCKFHFSLYWDFQVPEHQNGRHMAIFVDISSYRVDGSNKLVPKTFHDFFVIRVEVIKFVVICYISREMIMARCDMLLESLQR